MPGAGLQAYRRTDVVTADPKKLVILCYEAAIHSLVVAQAKYESQQFEEKAQAIQNALDIINELRAALNFEKGGIIAKSLASLYGFWTQHILLADRRRDPNALEHVKRMLSEIKSALEEAYYGRQESQEIPVPSIAEPRFDATRERSFPRPYSPK